MTNTHEGQACWWAGLPAHPTQLPSLPGPQLILTAPGELPKALVVLVVVVQDSVEAGGAQVQQSVVGCLLLLAARVAVEEVVDLVCYFWAEGQGVFSGVQGKARIKPTRAQAQF